MQSPVLDLLVRRRLAVLAGLLLFLTVVLFKPDGDWQYFTWGGRILFGGHPDFQNLGGHIPAAAPGGLHTYANYPMLQIGPPGLLLGRLLAFGPALVAGLVIAALGWLTVFAIDRAFPRRPVTVLVGGLFVTFAWGAVVHFGHLDDALALAAVAGAALAITRQRWVSLGLLVGLAAATKPWAVAILPMVLAAPIWRERIKSAACAIGVTAVCWVPFFIADTGTLKLGSQTFEPSARSALAVFGAQHMTHPAGLRLAQFVIGAALVAVLVLRGHWQAAPLAAFAFRLAIDPMYYPYYAAGVLVGALLYDASRARRFPVLTSAVGAVWLVASQLPARIAAPVTLTAYLSALVVALSVLVQAVPKNRSSASKVSPGALPPDVPNCESWRVAETAPVRVVVAGDST